MAERVQIRRAGLPDCGVIAALLRAAFAEFKALYTEGGFAATTPGPEQVKARMEEGPVWVALHGSLIVGTVAAVKRRGSVYVRGMAVLPSARGLGVGAQLLERVEGWAVSENILRIFLSTTPFLDSAIRLYETSGFHRTQEGAQDLFGTPLFTMEKVIGE